jgi:TRAP-type C4-dicarboxylate transport system substrate-binding protein
MLSEKLTQISRRDLLRLTRRYGITSTLLAAGSMTGAISLARLAEAANSTYDKRFKSEPKFTLKFGAAGFNERNLLIERAGCLQFAADLEERTDGAIRVEFIGSNQICGQLDCVKKTQQGIVDIFAASTQNSAGGAPYLNVLDYAYMFPSRASQYYFLYHPGSEKVLREPLRKRHNLHFLFSHAELRGIQLGLKWKDKPLVTSVTELAGTKNRGATTRRSTT